MKMNKQGKKFSWLITLILSVVAIVLIVMMIYGVQQNLIQLPIS